MSQKQTKTKSKRAVDVIRTDVWNLIASIDERQQMSMTVEEYRQFLMPVVLVVNAQWVNLELLTVKERVNVVEKMIHKTADNPAPKHSYFQNANVIKRHPAFRKFPALPSSCCNC